MDKKELVRCLATQLVNNLQAWGVNTEREWRNAWLHLDGECKCFMDLTKPYCPFTHSMDENVVAAIIVHSTKLLVDSLVASGVLDQKSREEYLNLASEKICILKLMAEKRKGEEEQE